MRSSLLRGYSRTFTVLSPKVRCQPDTSHGSISPFLRSRDFSPVLTHGCVTQVRSIGSNTDPVLSNFRNMPSTIEPGQYSNIVDYIETVQGTGKIAVIFSEFPPVLWTVDLLCSMKDLPGMTWIGVIISGTILIRALVGLPVAVVQQKSLARLESLKPELIKLGEDLKMETAIAVRRFNWNEKIARTQFTKSYKKHWRRIVEENKCHPMRSVALSLTQLPFWICFSTALRNVVYAVPLPRNPENVGRWLQIHNEGTPWAESLVFADPVVFPVVFLVANLLNIEVSRMQKKLQTVPLTKMQKVFPWVLRGGIVFIACFATSVPSAVSMYWATSSSLALVQNLCLNSERTKQFFKIPISSSEIQASNTNKSL